MHPVEGGGFLCRNVGERCFLIQIVSGFFYDLPDVVGGILACRQIEVGNAVQAGELPLGFFRNIFQPGFLCVEYGGFRFGADPVHIVPVLPAVSVVVGVVQKSRIEIMDFFHCLCTAEENLGVVPVGGKGDLAVAKGQSVQPVAQLFQLFPAAFGKDILRMQVPDLFQELVTQALGNAGTLGFQAGSYFRRKAVKCSDRRQDSVLFRRRFSIG